MSKAEVRAVDRDEKTVRLRFVDAPPEEMGRWARLLDKTVNMGEPQDAFLAGQKRERAAVLKLAGKLAQGLQGDALNAVMNILDAIEAAPLGELP